jgi:hypothetical protein
VGGDDTPPSKPEGRPDVNRIAQQIEETGSFEELQDLLDSYNRG